MAFQWVRLASFLMFIGVVLGAFGSHALKPRLSEYAADIYKTAVLYHFIHALGLFVVAWLVAQWGDTPAIHYAGLFFVLGILFFSGSLYLLAVTGIRWLGAVTPVGGVCFLSGWALLFFSRLPKSF